MITYTHFGKQPDVLKHLVLCEVLKIEKPQVYVETNSACAIYTMAHTPEQEYGIYHFLNKAQEDSILKNSFYYQLENESMANENYLGSPALAIKMLQNSVQRYLFFDLEQEALNNIMSFARKHAIESQIDTFNCDSLNEVLKLLPLLPKSTFLHIDPYEIDKANEDGTFASEPSNIEFEFLEKMPSVPTSDVDITANVPADGVEKSAYSMTVYGPNNDGANMSMIFTKVPDKLNTWTITFAVDGAQAATAEPVEAVFSSEGELISPKTMTVNVEWNDGSSGNINVDITNITQYAGDDVLDDPHLCGGICRMYFRDSERN